MVAFWRMFARVRHIYQTLEASPGYTLMRGIARFEPVRRVVITARGLMQQNALLAYIKKCQVRKSETLFPNIDPVRFADDLDKKGVVFGLKLPSSETEEVRRFADTATCYADRDKDKGFQLSDRAIVEQKLGKPLLLAQYYNVEQTCAPIARLINDPVLKEIAARYLGSVPTFVGANLWWTFPVNASAQDRARHAHMFHRDVDDFRFFKFFFYFTDVELNDGAHMCVAYSHRRPPVFQMSDHWKIRRYTDEEVASLYPKQDILEITGKMGDGFAENTLCLHKARTPERAPRLCLSLTYGFFDYGTMHDRCDPAALKKIA